LKKKFKHFISNNLGIFITFLASLIVIIAVFILQNVTPLGSNSLLTIDFFHQYGPMLSELYNRIHSGSNLLYSFNMAMGLPFFRNFFNYLSSPFNLIMLFFSHRGLLASYSVIIGLKAIASSVTMYYYLKKKFSYNGLYTIPLAILYAFCAYFTAYYWNIMWLDGLVFLPLITLGIEKIVNENKYLLYVISLAIMLFANYFIAYMICIFSVLYFIAYLIIKTSKWDIKNILKKCLIFGFSSLLAGGLCAWFLIPLYYGLQTISATSDVFPTSQYYAFTLKEFIFNHFSGVGSTVLKSGISNAPNISVGIFPLALVIIFIINPNIKLKTKVSYLVLLGILFFSFIFAPADFIWHGFHVPNDLPYRYSFLYSFVIIIMAAYGITSIKKIKSFYVYFTYVLMLIGTLSLFIFNYSNIKKDMILLNGIVITIAFLCYIIYTKFDSFKKLIPYILIITSILECIIVVNNNWAVSQVEKFFYSDYNGTEKALTKIRKNDKELMYRIERTNILTYNDPSWYNYYGQTTFSSMAYENMAILQNSLGLPGNEINSYYYKETTPVYDLMFNIKYFIGENKDINRYELISNTDNIVINKNDYTNGLMYGVSKNIKKWKYNLDNPFIIQNDYMKKSTNSKEDVFEKITNYQKEEIYNKDGNKIIKYTINNPNDNLYFYYRSSNIDFIIVDDTLYFTNENYHYVNDLKYKLNIFSYTDFHENYILNTRTDKKTYTFYVGYNNYYSDNIMVYTINQKTFNNDYQILKNQKINIEEFKEYYIKGTIKNVENEAIYTSIPYDEGWNVYIDGEKISTYKIGNALLGFDLQKGEHTIELKYMIPKIKISLIFSIFSFFCLLLSLLIKKRNN
jgi:uncharacterized membrane protein YfhO